MNTWLVERFGVALISCTAGEWEMPRMLHLSQGLTVHDLPHVVVGFGGQLLHDPHPSGRGLSTVLSHELFVAIRPGGQSAVPARRPRMPAAAHARAADAGNCVAHDVGRRWGEAVHALWGSESPHRISKVPATSTGGVMVSAVRTSELEGEHAACASDGARALQRRHDAVCLLWPGQAAISCLGSRRWRWGDPSEGDRLRRPVLSLADQKDFPAGSAGALSQLQSGEERLRFLPTYSQRARGRQSSDSDRAESGSNVTLASVAQCATQRPRPAVAEFRTVLVKSFTFPLCRTRVSLRTEKGDSARDANKTNTLKVCNGCHRTAALRLSSRSTRRWEVRPPGTMPGLHEGAYGGIPPYTRLRVLRHYSGGSMQCACCGETEVDFLGIDHIDGDGAQHRREVRPSAHLSMVDQTQVSVRNSDPVPQLQPGKGVLWLVPTPRPGRREPGKGRQPDSVRRWPSQFDQRARASIRCVM